MNVPFPSYLCDFRCHCGEHVASASPNYHDRPRIMARRSSQATTVGAQVLVSDPGQLDQQLPPARDGSATLLHATADESSVVAGKRHRRLASRSLEKSSRCQVRGFGNTPSRFLKATGDMHNSECYAGTHMWDHFWHDDVVKQ
jgi:hypothetical protein